MEELVLGLSLCVLTGLDMFVSKKRWKQGSQDWNPIVRHFAKKSLTEGLLALGSTNLLVTAASILFLPFGYMVLGSKLTLGAIQIRSLINE